MGRRDRDAARAADARSERDAIYGGNARRFYGSGV